MLNLRNLLNLIKNKSDKVVVKELLVDNKKTNLLQDKVTISQVLSNSSDNFLNREIISIDASGLLGVTTYEIIIR